MTTTDHHPTTAPSPASLRSPWPRREAMDLADTAYRRMVDLLADLDDDDWGCATDCEGWTVRDLAGHVVGAMRSAASIRELVSQQREADRRAAADGRSPVDHLTALQVERTADLSRADLVAEARALIGPATRGRRRTPAPLRRFLSFPVRMSGIDERWRLGYLVDVILTRDMWLHRVDLCRAVGREPHLTADHDGRIVADVVDEWSRRHGRPFALTLTGPAGGRFGTGGEADEIELDAVEFCRIVSGRSTGAGLLSTEVPF